MKSVCSSSHSSLPPHVSLSMSVSPCTLSRSIFSLVCLSLNIESVNIELSAHLIKYQILLFSLCVSWSVNFCLSLCLSPALYSRCTLSVSILSLLLCLCLYHSPSLCPSLLLSISSVSFSLVCCDTVSSLLFPQQFKSSLPFSPFSH